MASATASSSSVRPTAFAALLRRSKFASYDPAIAQTYTAPLAHRSRGTFGFKRQRSVAPKASKAAFITVDAADTPYNYWEWESAESSVRWIRRMEELNTPVALHKSTRSGNWKDRLDDARPQYRTTWYEDSEFDRTPGPQPVSADEPKESPNYRRMRKKQFERYLDDVHGMRAEFVKWLEERRYLQIQMEKSKDQKGKHVHIDYGRPDRPIDLYALAQSPWNIPLYQQFLRTRTPPELHDQLAGVPHPVAALSYSSPSPLQSFLLSTPIPGIILGDTPWWEPPRATASSTVDRRRSKGQRQWETLVGAAGHVARLEQRFSEGIGGHKMADDPDRRKPRFRVWKAALRRAPEVVDAREDVSEVGLDLSLRAVETGEQVRSNPHRPGTAPYIAIEPSVSQPAQKQAATRGFFNLSGKAEEAKRAKAGKRRASGSLRGPKNAGAGGTPNVNATFVDVLVGVLEQPRLANRSRRKRGLPPSPADPRSTPSPRPSDSAPSTPGKPTSP